MIASLVACIAREKEIVKFVAHVLMGNQNPSVVNAHPQGFVFTRKKSLIVVNVLVVPFVLMEKEKEIALSVDHVLMEN